MLSIAIPEIHTGGDDDDDDGGYYLLSLSAKSAPWKQSSKKSLLQICLYL